MRQYLGTPSGIFCVASTLSLDRSSFWRKLNGIPNQVDDDLDDARGIACDRQGLFLKCGFYLNLLFAGLHLDFSEGILHQRNKVLAS